MLLSPACASGTAENSDTRGSGGGGGLGNLCRRCSASLREVLNCDGSVAEVCADDVACHDGSCSSDPCSAAAASKSSYGCEYWAVVPSVIPEFRGGCFAAIVVNTWTTSVRLSVQYRGAELGADFISIPRANGTEVSLVDYDPDVGLPPDEAAVIFLSNERLVHSEAPGCPFYRAALDYDASVYRTGRGNAFRITTDRPAVAYSVSPYGGGRAQLASSSLLLPTSVWDTNYVAVNGYRASRNTLGGQPSLSILAREDGTEVVIRPVAPVEGATYVAQSPADTPVSYWLDAGEYVQLSQDEELTGSPIQANKPVGLWGGVSCLNVPADAAAADTAHQQIPPVRALGSEYVGVRYRNRRDAQSEEKPPWRLVGVADGTVLTWEPAMPEGAAHSVQEGEVLEFRSAGPFVVSSQDAAHPFYLGQYMTGAQHIASDGEGDAEWVNVVPAAQYLDNYVFFTDPSYSETSLVIVRQASEEGTVFADVVLDCAGAIGGWQKIGRFEYTRIDLVTGDFEGVNGCTNGVRKIRSAEPFGVTVWGWGTAEATPSTDWVSYAYPAGANIALINDVVFPTIPR
jgi:hypothetical protein